MPALLRQKAMIVLEEDRAARIWGLSPAVRDTGAALALSTSTVGSCSGGVAGDLGSAGSGPQSAG